MGKTVKVKQKQENGGMEGYTDSRVNSTRQVRA